MPQTRPCALNEPPACASSLHDPTSDHGAAAQVISPRAKVAKEDRKKIIHLDGLFNMLVLRHGSVVGVALFATASSIFMEPSGVPRDVVWMSFIYTYSPGMFETYGPGIRKLRWDFKMFKTL